MKSAEDSFAPAPIRKLLSVLFAYVLETVVVKLPFIYTTSEPVDLFKVKQR
jgi:hypothetical protein